MMPQKNTKHIDLLVVDSNVNDYLAFSTEARVADLNWQNAHSGHDALQTASGKEVHLWISNMELPDMSGIELLELVKAKRPGAPFYLVSDHYSPETERKARAAGANGYLSKPADHTWFELSRLALGRVTVRAGPRSRGKASRVR